jgi:cytosine/adenosine deaminase-related metal-dependent hydrolase
MPFDMDFRNAVMRMRKQGMTVNDIALAMDLHKTSEREAIAVICQAKELRRYGHGIEVGGPVKAGANRSQRPTT